MNYYLVINLGLRSIRAILFDESGTIVQKNWYPIETQIQGAHVEQDPDEWWGLACRLIEEVLKPEEHRKNLRAITVTSSACCLVVTDRRGDPLINSFLVSDKRAVKQAEAMKSNHHLRTVFTNPNFLPVASYMFPKISWIADKMPSVFKKAVHFMAANDFLLYKLTGKVITDHLNAEKFYYDGAYPTALLRSLSLSTKQFPTVQPIGSVIGPVSSAVRKTFHIPQSTRVILSTYDAICAFIGSGALAEGEMCNVCGTVSSIRAFTKKNIQPSGGILAQTFGTFSIVGGSNNIDGGLLEWAKHMFYGDSYPEKYIYKIMEDEASQSPPGARGLLFLPYIIGERLPFFDSSARGLFFGLERFHRRNDIVRSIFEASGFMAHDIISTIEKYGLSIKHIRMSGGMTQNELICKIRADITGKKVSLIDKVEITSLGALFIMLKAVGSINNIAQAAKMVAVKTVYTPDTMNHKKYQKLFCLFKRLYHTNKQLMVERENLIRDFIQSEQHTLENL